MNSRNHMIKRSLSELVLHGPSCSHSHVHGIVKIDVWPMESHLVIFCALHDVYVLYVYASMAEYDIKC